MALLSCCPAPSVAAAGPSPLLGPGPADPESRDQRGEASSAGFLSESATFIYTVGTHYCFSITLTAARGRPSDCSTHTDHHQRLCSQTQASPRGYTSQSETPVRQFFVLFCFFGGVGVVVAHGTAHRESALRLGYTC